MIPATRSQVAAAFLLLGVVVIACAGLVAGKAAAPAKQLAETTAHTALRACDVANRSQRAHEIIDSTGPEDHEGERNRVQINFVDMVAECGRPIVRRGRAYQRPGPERMRTNRCR